MSNVGSSFRGMNPEPVPEPHTVLEMQWNLSLEDTVSTGSASKI